MKLSSSNIKKFIIFQEVTFQTPKNKKNLPQENFLYSREEKPQKNVLYFLKRKLFEYFGKQKPREKLFKFQEMETLKNSYISRSNFTSLKIRKFLYFSLYFLKFFIFQETENLKNFLYFRKQNFLIFQEMENPKNSYILGSKFTSLKIKKVLYFSLYRSKIFYIKILFYNKTFFLIL